MVEFQNELGAVEYGMLKVLVEGDGVVRTGIHTQLAEDAGAQIVFVGSQHFFLLSVFCFYRFAGHMDGAVGTGRLAESAGHTVVLVVLVVRHGQGSAETVEHLQLFPVFGILFGHFLAEVDFDTGLHTRCQCADAVYQTS